jgi:dihydrodipicolinate synthase/N-acetylneuraminate lyase
MAAIGAATSLGLFVYSRDWVKPSAGWVEQLAHRIPTLIAWKDGQGDTVRYQQIMDRVGCTGSAVRVMPGCLPIIRSAFVLTLQTLPPSRPNFHCVWMNWLPPGIPPHLPS